MTLIERLRKDFPSDPRIDGSPEMKLRWEAADELERKQEIIDRLEGALQQIVDEIPPNGHKKWHHHHHYRFIAEKALGE